MSKAADLAGYQIALKTALIEFTDGDDAIAIADAGVVTLLTTAVAKSEGGAVTTNIAQGLAKAWINLNGTGTPAIVDDFNVGGITDNTTGDVTITFTTAMANTSYAFSGGLSSTSDRAILILNNGVALTAAAATFQTIFDGDTKIDCGVVTIQIAGDLA